MGFLDWLSSPYSSFAHTLRGNDGGMLRRGTYKIAPGPHGVPMVQLDLQFDRWIKPVANPDMTLAVVLDRSGSMAEAFNDGHVYNMCSTILNAVSAAGVGYDLVFYNNQPSYAGHIASDRDLTRAIANNQPSGGTTVTAAIKGAIERYQKPGKGIYLIVITDGEFSDKVEVERYVTTTLLPKLTPKDPYAFRLHFVGAGHGVDHEFLRKMEDLATGQGVPLVTAHHHAHLSHAHDDVISELEGAFLGIGTDALVGDASLVTEGRVPETHDAHDLVGRVGDLTTRAWKDGQVTHWRFLPKRVSLGLEYAAEHPSHLEVGLRFTTADMRRELAIYNVPLPRQAATPVRGGWLIKLLQGESPEQRAQREALERETEAVAKAEAKRQATDLRELAKGGIPVQARERLKELGQSGDAEGAIFTSNLSPDEMALLRRNGFRARGMVMGSAMYHVGQAYASANSDVEVTVLSEAYNHATELAVNRMKQELKLIGAHGVIGVRLAMARHEWGEKSVEVQVVGTAIEGPGRLLGDPWLSDLSAQEWWALYRAGYEPAALVWGHCTWFLLTTMDDELTEKGWDNRELTHWSRGLQQARHRAMAHIQQQAEMVGAHGITGVHFERRVDEVRLTGTDENPAYEREHHNLVVSITGTAIRRRPGAPMAVPQTQLVLSLRDTSLVASRMAGSSAVALEEEL